MTEFPKITETFILRDVIGLHDCGYEIRLFHLTHFNHKEVVHEFAKETLTWARDYAYIASLAVIGATFRAVWRHPRAVFGVVRDIITGCRSDPVMLLKSLFILPKSLRIAEDLQRWGAQHVHAAYAGHPATCAWIIRRIADIPFSASSHAHDIFETGALLSVKLPEADFLRTVSQYNLRYMLTHIPALAERPPVVIHVGANLVGIEPSSFTADPAAPFRLLYVGSLETRKGVDVLLRALVEAKLGDWELDIIGKGPERRRLEDLTQYLGIQAQVTFRGGLSNEQVSKSMSQASLLVVPSRIGPRNQTEGLPTVIVEALAHGRPVVATRLTGIPEIIIDGVTGLLFEVDDVAGLRHALEAVRSDPATAQRRAAKGRALVRSEFDQNINVAALADLIGDSVTAYRARQP
ncbi:MAG: glycosyltransferase family 4 protein [Candidatus Kaistia colombiensis]|nr:MAG: glycosyltransferase family 4 protein [Kaistia sp.]